MPELPYVTVYVEALRRFVVGHEVQGVRLLNPFLLRTVEPPLATVVGRRVVSADRLGKRLVLGLDGAVFLVIHLMIAGRLRWRGVGRKVARRPIAVPASQERLAEDG